jgi:TonB-linked SusC/RagA family outer membrane protein
MHFAPKTKLLTHMTKHYKTLLAFVVSLMLGTAAVFAQTVTGKVTDASDQAMPGVNVIKKGTAQGTTTDAAGIFTIEASGEDVLVFSFIGYTSQDIRVGTQTNLSIKLEEDVVALSEVVVVGYGTQRKSDLTGAVASVSSAKLAQSMVANVDQAFQGRIPGVMVQNNSGAPGGATTVTIRGVSSFGSNQPLYVIDGIQFYGDGVGVAGMTDGANGQTRVNPLSTINPNDIVSIDVLKDASASAIYGSRASNGVILITTKRGKSGEAKISYNGYYGVAGLRSKQEVMNLQQYADYRKNIATETNQQVDQHYLDPSLLGEGTDWQDEVFRQAGQQNHSISATGGTDKTQYAIMGGFFQQDGIAINSDMTRFTSRVNIDTQVKDWFKIGTNFAYTNAFSNLLNDGSGDGIFAQALAMQPDVPVRDANGEYAGPPPSVNSAEVKFNPVAIANLRTNTLAQQRIMANFYGDLRIMKDLTFRSEFSIDNNQTQNINFNPTYKWGSLVSTENVLQDQRSTSFNWIWKNYATYNLTVAGGHNLTAMLGMEAVKGTYEQIRVVKKNLATNDIPVLSQGDNLGQTTNGVLNTNTLSSYFARLNYNFRDRYLMTLTLRNDGSSKFGPENRRGFFPAASFAWHLSNEEFMQSLSGISDLKLRVGYGEVGNQNIASYAFGSSLASVISPFGTTYKLDRLPNPAVQWEAGTQLNIGMDLSLLAGRVDLTVDVFKRGTKGFLMDLPIPLYLGGAAGGGVFAINAPIVNLGGMENKGIDLGLNTHNITTPNFSWDTDLVFSLFRNKITKLDNSDVVNSNVYLYGVYSVPTRSQVGMPIGQFYGYVTEGLFQSEQDIIDHAVQVKRSGSETTEKPQGENYVHRQDGVWIGDIKYKDLNEDGLIDSRDQTFIGNPNPKFTFGFNNLFTYKSFSFAVFITGSYGGDIFNALRIRTEGMQNASNNQNAVVANRAIVDLIAPTGDDDQDALDREDITKVQLRNADSDIPRYSATDVNGNSRIPSDRWIEKGSYLRIQNISLGYTVPAQWIAKTKLTRVRVYGNAQNAFTFTKYSGYDPEVGANNQNLLQQSVDSGRYPTPKLFTIGLDVDF